MSILYQLPVSLLGAGLARLIGGKAKGPIDTTGIDRAYIDRGRANLHDTFDQNYNKAMDSARQQGLSGSASISAMQGLFDSHSDKASDFECMEADSLSRAKAYFLGRNRDFQNQQGAARAGAISDIFGNINQLDTMQRMLGDKDTVTDLDKAGNWISGLFKRNR
jgi:hypothetical protein